MASSWCGAIVWVDVGLDEFSEPVDRISEVCHLLSEHPEQGHWNPSIGTWHGGVETDLTTRGQG